MNKILLNIVIRDKNKFNIYKNYFDNIYSSYFNIQIVNGNIIDFQNDVIVSAGNSYGMMDGGIDGDINYYLNYIHNDVQFIIKNKYYGELPVGTSILLQINKNKVPYSNFKYLCYTPTMKVPEDVSTFLNSYLALRSVLVLCLNNKTIINSIIIPLFCGGAGNMSDDILFHQYKSAIESLENNNIKFEWNHIWKNHKLLIKK